jgi:carbamoyl-phosphate synthase large subunit
VDSIKILITGAGSPGIAGTIKSLKDNYDKRQLYLIGADIKSEVVGKYLCDDFIQIKAANSPEYLDCIYNACKSLSIDILLPQNTLELLILSQHKVLFDKIGVKIIVSDYDSIYVANDKYNLMKCFEELGLPVGKSTLVSNKREMIEAATALGWPLKKVVVKPPISNGQRGVRVIDEDFNPKDSFYNDKPSDLITSMNGLLAIIGDNFPVLIVTEYLSGMEYSVDILNHKTLNEPVVIPRTRDYIRSGISFVGMVDENREIIEISKKVVKELNLEYCFGFQFKLDENNIPKILECNPRVQGTMVLSTIADANIIYSAVKLAVGESLPDFDIKWGSRIMRYWGAVGINGKTGDSYII